MLALSTMACSTILGIEDREVGDPAGGQVALGTEPDAAISGGISLAPAGCDAVARITPTVIDERCGTFVSSNGNDGAAGTRQAPFLTIAAAARAAVNRKLYRVFLCGASYSERVQLLFDGVSMVGGLDCATWAPTPTPTLIQSTSAEPALTIDTAKNAVIYESIELESKPGSAAQATSNALIIGDSPSVTFRTSRLRAGAGAPGHDGAPGLVGTGGGTAGNPASTATPGQQAVCTCTLQGTTLGTSTGGSGGVYNGAPATAGLPAGSGGAGGANAATLGANCTPGGTGADGAPGTTPASPASVGAMTANGWVSQAGSKGLQGAIGQGGGGGGDYFGYAGGGGGCGGCPSTGGGGGAGGGASIGAIIFNSNVSFIETEIIPGAGGAGGKGGLSVDGQGGGAGAGNAAGYGCAGGSGGKGGRGGDGGGGAGGSSFGILYRGAAPILDDVSKAKLGAGTAGAPGTGGVPGNPGVSEAVHELKPAS